jgi:Mor family transcriptional regulator
MTAMHRDEQEVDALSVIEEEARIVARCFGVAASEEAAAALVERVGMRLGGRKVYVGGARRAGERIVEEIRKCFTGSNLAELATKFNKSERQVRRIVARKLNAKK